MAVPSVRGRQLRSVATRPKINMEEPQPLSFGGQTPAQEDLRGPGGILVRHDHCYTKAVTGTIVGRLTQMPYWSLGPYDGTRGGVGVDVNFLHF